ncbi:MAG: reverse transcriptase-like protein [Endomicrobia bacterium]|nr:reverse transcriptase-like protein [Endomicrobiia bacterium]MCL2506111.1 reverse transcriptase-like protein [Endomicrobiia bacterium]
MSLYKTELQNKALKFKKNLQNSGIDISFGDNSFRDYLLILEISKDGKSQGKISMYYKPSKNTFSIKKQIANTETEKQIDDIWDNLNGSSVYSADSGIYEAFVDGSYIGGVTGYGTVIFLGDEIKAKLSGTIADTEFRQFGGELRSVIEALKWCAENGVSTVRINYDYEGIEKFSTGVWQAKTNLSKNYVDFLRKINIKIEWRHIKSHTGNSKNDIADKLAKEAALNSKAT